MEIRSVDVNYSFWDNVLEEKAGKYYALRLGFRQIHGMQVEGVQILMKARKGLFTNINQLSDAGVSVSTLELLAGADAFRWSGFDRRQGLWEISALYGHPVGVFTGQPSESAMEENSHLPQMSSSQHVVEDYGSNSASIDHLILLPFDKKILLINHSLLNE